MTDKKRLQKDAHYALRLPVELYEQLREMAQDNYCSVNAEIVRLIRKGAELERPSKVRHPSPQ